MRELLANVWELFWRKQRLLVDCGWKLQEREGPGCHRGKRAGSPSAPHVLVFSFQLTASLHDCARLAPLPSALLSRLLAASIPAPLAWGSQPCAGCQPLADGAPWAMKGTESPLRGGGGGRDKVQVPVSNLQLSSSLGLFWPARGGVSLFGSIHRGGLSSRMSKFAELWVLYSEGE